MGNITDDIRQHFDTFAELPFTEADSLALSQLAYARMPDNVPRYHENAETADGMIATVPIHDLLRAECYDDMFGKVWSPSMNVDLLRAMSESPRWRNLRVGAYVDEFDAETTKQFSACVFELGNGTLYVAFRGTDSSIVGWKRGLHDGVPPPGRLAGGRRALSDRAGWPLGRADYGRRPFQRRQSGGVCGGQCA